MNMITVKIDVTKVDKARLFEGKNGAKYLDLVLIERQDQYGNDYMAVQGVTKEERLAGVKGAILGNGKHIGGQQQQRRPQGQPSGQVRRAGEANASMTRTQAAATQSQDDDSSDIPF